MVKLKVKIIYILYIYICIYFSRIIFRGYVELTDGK